MHSFGRSYSSLACIVCVICVDRYTETHIMFIYGSDGLSDGDLWAAICVDSEIPPEIPSEVHWNVFRWRILPGQINLIDQKRFKNRSKNFQVRSHRCGFVIPRQGDALKRCSLRRCKARFHLSHLPKFHVIGSPRLEVMTGLSSCGAKVDIFGLPFNLAYLWWNNVKLRYSPHTCFLLF